LVDVGAASVCTATVSDREAGATSVPSGTVSFTHTGAGDFSAPSCTLSGGACSVTYTPADAGAHSIAAAYAGAGDHAASTAATGLRAAAPRVESRAVLPPPSIMPPAPPADGLIIDGLERVTGVRWTGTSVTFTQRPASAGILRWTLDLSFYRARKGAMIAKVRTPIRIASGSRTVTSADDTTVTLTLGKNARRQLKRHPGARLVLRTTLTLANGRVLRATKTLSRRAAGI
jgi:hypothetical protein